MRKSSAEALSQVWWPSRGVRWRISLLQPSSRSVRGKWVTLHNEQLVGLGCLFKSLFWVGFLCTAFFVLSESLCLFRGECFAFSDSFTWFVSYKQQQALTEPPTFSDKFPYVWIFPGHVTRAASECFLECEQKTKACSSASVRQEAPNSVARAEVMGLHMLSLKHHTRRVV